MKRLLASVVVAAGLWAGVGPAQAQGVEQAKGVNCAAWIYKPTWLWRRGAWRPVNQGHLTTEEWLHACRGRVVARKNSPKVPDGPWRVNVKLNAGNCSYTADQDLKDWGWWRNARIVIS